MTSVLVVAGEKSGEDHAMTFVPDLIKKIPDLKLFGVGGDELEALGMELIYHLKEFSTWGVGEALTKIPFYYQALARLEQLVLERKVKAVILIDYQTFNLKLAERLGKHGVKVLYYVAPQAWAWKSYRAKTLAKCVHTLFTIIPFEEKWFKERGVKRTMPVVHPLCLQYRNHFPNLVKGFPGKKWKILLLPGSRKGEVLRTLPVFISAIHELKKDFDIEVGLVKVDHLSDKYYQAYYKQLDQVWNQKELKEACSWANLSFACSGTVTLATGLLGLPSLVCYDSGLLNKFIFESFINYDWFASLFNIVHEAEVFPELLGERMTVYNLVRASKELMSEEKKYLRIAEKCLNTHKFWNLSKGEVGDYMAEVILSS